FMLSQFLHGEQGALLATAKIVQGVPWAEAKFYAANQVADEARHVEVYHRYLTEKLGVSYEVVPSLNRLLDDIILDARWDVTFLGMQIMVEGLALAAFGVTRMQLADEPLIQDLIGRVMADESRHVAFGVLSLSELYTKEMSATELREREEFIIDATVLLRDRLRPTPVFERLGWDAAVWTTWADTTPFMRRLRLRGGRVVERTLDSGGHSGHRVPLATAPISRATGDTSTPSSVTRARVARGWASGPSCSPPLGLNRDPVAAAPQEEVQPRPHVPESGHPLRAPDCTPA